ncbi:MAG: family 10 glycosylhydrolase [Clostridiales bacterium]|nr:family 10 glycosylhydrolase [Clostridiales bacterium]
MSLPKAKESAFVKNLIAVLLILTFLLSFSGCLGETSPAPGTTSSTHKSNDPPKTAAEEMRAVWLTHNEIYHMCKSEEGFTQSTENAFSRLSEAGINTVIVQMRPFSDALYRSDIFPSSSYLGIIQGEAPAFDALEIVISAAEKHSLSVHAWINPFRVSYGTDFSALADTNPAKIWYTEDASSPDLIVCEKGIWYKPSSPRVQKLIIDGACEIVRNYDIDAIHIDDYFYPVTDENIDAAQYAEYTALGGTLSLEQWRREQISCTVAGLYAAIKRIKAHVLLGISPSGKMSYNRDEMYADVAKWCAQSGYLDYIAPQLYYGFENEICPFESTAREWQELVKDPDITLIFGLAAYKCGNEDEFAARAESTGSAKYEWVNNSDIIRRQINFVRSLEKHGGFALFSFSGIWNTNIDDFSP